MCLHIFDCFSFNVRCLSRRSFEFSKIKTHYGNDKIPPINCAHFQWSFFFVLNNKLSRNEIHQENTVSNRNKSIVKIIRKPKHHIAFWFYLNWFHFSFGTSATTSHLIISNLISRQTISDSSFNFYNECKSKIEWKKNTTLEYMILKSQKHKNSQTIIFSSHQISSVKDWNFRIHHN